MAHSVLPTALQILFIPRRHHEAVYLKLDLRTAVMPNTACYQAHLIKYNSLSVLQTSL
jgi:hypothetical protein